jgi:hypothetical protein
LQVRVFARSTAPFRGRPSHTMPRVSLRRAFTAAAVSAAIGLASTPIASAQTTPSLTPDQAKTIVAAYDTANTNNNATLDIEGQAKVEGAPIQQVDDATFRDFQGRGKSGLGNQFKIGNIKVAVPSQSPVTQFLATTTVTSSDGSNEQYLLFTRGTEADPWKVTMSAQLDKGSAPKLAKDKDGFVSVVDADHAATLLAKPADLAGELSNVWAKDAGEERATKHVFANGPLTTGAVDQFVQELSQSNINGKADFKFEPNEAPPAAYRTANGGALVLFALNVHETVQATGSNGLVQPDSREVFGGLVPPGQYGAVRYERTSILAALVPPKGKKARAKIIGIYDGITAASAVPAGAISSA